VLSSVLFIGEVDSARTKYLSLRIMYGTLILRILVYYRRLPVFPILPLYKHERYMKHGLSFVMGTTGGDRDNINEQNMQASSCKAVVAPNMAKQIVALQVLKRAEERGILHSYLFYLLLSLTLLKTGLL